MELITSNDSFDAYKTEAGYEIQEKKNSAKKFGIITMVMGAGFVAISFINLRALLDWEWIHSVFHGVFLYGGVTLLALGAFLFVAKGLMGGEPISTFNAQTKEFTQRGKVIPFAEMSEIAMQANEVMGKNMIAVLYNRNGKRRAIVGGTLIMSNTESLESFIGDLNAMIEA
jgi:hypothetical protein